VGFSFGLIFSDVEVLRSPRCLGWKIEIGLIRRGRVSDLGCMSTNTLSENNASDAPASEGAQVFQMQEDQLEAVTRYVVVNVNGNLYGMETDTTVELMSSSMTMITRVPHSPVFIAGVINHRGTIIPVIDARALLGFQLRGKEVEALKSLFAKLESDHVAWLDALEQSVRDGIAFDKPVDHNKCNFGRWYNSVMDGTVTECRDDLLEPTVNGLIKQFDGPHRRIHSIAKRVLTLRDEGETEKALEIIKSTRDSDLHEMIELFHKATKAISRIYESMLVITEHGGQKAAIAVDGVSFVADCKDSEIVPLPDTADNTEFLSGLVHRADGSYILVADIENIYTHACVGE
jgi:purine-binding chemotaxis protein CheW